MGVFLNTILINNRHVRLKNVDIYLLYFKIIVNITQYKFD